MLISKLNSHVNSTCSSSSSDLSPASSVWIVYNEGWGQITSYYPEFGLTDRVRQLDPTRLVDSTTGWYDHGAGDFSVRNFIIRALKSAAIDTINQTYEIDTTLEAWNYRGHHLLGKLLDQTAIWSCSGKIWIQTTDVEARSMAS
ncbi:hypothetical protein LTR56_023061 [Elasticomyces elasticus]|nr:hypothetical protein LTR56_023061 [Elasticomyces elasticus]KAK3623338.1 hypothetical protein LTR22_024417 [Elasticomyces elasticus]KAK4907300.1 hypothetical protein LTR49_023670 [Elasticomyces elasticus]KAK5747778.1 hypothetical protein LTS12_022177 [Elasticomyces elasticus]